MLRGKLVSAITLILMLGNVPASQSQSVVNKPYAAPPRIEPPFPKYRIRMKLNPEALPKGAHAQYPAYDGDSFAVTLPVQQVTNVSSNQVLRQTLIPILRAMGFTRAVERRTFRIPPENGIKQPVADFHKLAQTVAFEYANNKELRGPRTEKMLAVFLGKQRADEEINKALEMGEGMTYAQFVAGIERLEIQYPFQQMVGTAPIEHSAVIASRWQDQGITSVRGVVFNRYRVANKVVIPSALVGRRAVAALSKLKGVEKAYLSDRAATPVLVLLPYGSAANGVTQLRYAYRLLVDAAAAGQRGQFIVWLDARLGTILELQPLFGDTSATGAVYNRDPGIGSTTSFFEVNPALSGQYTLQLSNVMNRVDYQGDGFNASDVSISDNTNGSNASFANFDQVPINDASQALCSSGTNKAFQQVNFFATIYRYYQTVLGQGIFTPFPAGVWSPQVEIANYCNANAGMVYGACQGYFDAACPNYSDNGFGGNNFMNFAHDNTVVGHELAHSITPRLTNARPSNWCGMASCSMPVGWGNFHDLADFWADHFESTNCTAGWVAKNLGGVDNSLNCKNSDEGGYLPRFHSVTVPFNPAAAGDHFPEHRLNNNTCDYCDGQIGAAMLWQVRIGMRSKCRPSGLPQFGVRFQRALKNTGFFGTPPPSTDLGEYRMLYDLEYQMAYEWATSGSPNGPPAFAHNGPHTTNKVTAGFARGGVFLVPYQCVDGDSNTTDPNSCPNGEDGADAVIDIDDNDAANDITINGVSHPTYDFLKAGGVPPIFHVWTGLRYNFDVNGAATLNNPSPCNKKFNVEVSNDPSFPGASTITSGWTNVDMNPTTANSPECYGTWTPSNADWQTLQAGGNRIYYRARTRDAMNGDERLSTTPGNGLWTVPPPYAVITADGKSDY